jgi:hypothetical protein
MIRATYLLSCMWHISLVQLLLARLLKPSTYELEIGSCSLLFELYHHLIRCVWSICLTYSLPCVQPRHNALCLLVGLLA